MFTPGAATGRIVRVYAYKLVQMKAGHVGSTVLCGGAMKQRIKYSFYQAKCIYKKILLPPCFLVTKLPVCLTVCWVVIVASAVRIGVVLSCVVQSKARDSTTYLAADFGDVLSSRGPSEKR